MSKRPKLPRTKPVWPIGPISITTHEDRTVSVARPNTSHAGTKEEIESFFANRFVRQFNIDNPLGSESRINEIIQRTKDDPIDFDIVSRDFKYLEVAEATPSDTDFGRIALKTGQIDVYNFSKWIWQNIVRRKEQKNGETARRTILLIYCARQEFTMHGLLIDCLVSTIKKHGTAFGSIFVMNTVDDAFSILEKIYPRHELLVPQPSKYRNATYRNWLPENTAIETNMPLRE